MYITEADGELCWKKDLFSLIQAFRYTRLNYEPLQWQNAGNAWAQRTHVSCIVNSEETKGDCLPLYSLAIFFFCFEALGG